MLEDVETLAGLGVRIERHRGYLGYVLFITLFFPSLDPPVFTCR